METALHMNEFKFHKPGKRRNNKTIIGELINIKFKENI